MEREIRIFHRRVAPWIALLLAFLALSGMTYRVGRSWFGMSKETGGKILDLHAGEWLGSDGSVIYVVVAGLGALSLAATGAWMLLRWRKTKGLRNWHRVVGLVLLLPLSASAVTGIACRAGEEYFGISEETQHFLMLIHQGSWLGPHGKVIYILLLGASILMMIFTGWRMLRRR